MNKVFKPEPSAPVKCKCGVVVGFVMSGTGVPSVFCQVCSNPSRSIAEYRHNRLMATDRSSVGDMIFTRLVLDDAIVQESGKHSAIPNKFYILTFNHEVTRVIGSSGYADTPELAWTQVADKIDKYLREPYGYVRKDEDTVCP